VPTVTFDILYVFVVLLLERRRILHVNVTARQLRIAPRSPWQNGYAERLVGTFRRELTEHMIVLSERQLLRCVREYAKFYNADRPHMSLDGDAPSGRAIEPPETGKVISLPRPGGLHHRYVRGAA
jgi:putative transposase